jgi:hypothetical protein
MKEDPKGIAVMLAAEGERCTEAVVRNLLAELTDSCGAVTVAAVAERPHPASSWAPLAGVTLAEVRADTLTQAADRACDAAAGCTAGIRVDHLGAASWRDVRRVLTAGSYDVLAIRCSGRPSPSRRAVIGEARNRGIRVLRLKP